MNRNYLRYLFRTYKVLIFFFLAMYLCICLLWNLFSDPGIPGYGFYNGVKAAIGLSIILSYALPVLLFSDRALSCDGVTLRAMASLIRNTCGDDGRDVLGTRSFSLETARDAGRMRGRCEVPASCSREPASLF